MISKGQLGQVLILVLMEDTLRGVAVFNDREDFLAVLILVLMEDTLRAAAWILIALDRAS